MYLIYIRSFTVCKVVSFPLSGFNTLGIIYALFKFRHVLLVLQALMSYNCRSVAYSRVLLSCCFFSTSLHSLCLEVVNWRYLLFSRKAIWRNNCQLFFIFQPCGNRFSIRWIIVSLIFSLFLIVDTTFFSTWKHFFHFFHLFLIMEAVSLSGGENFSSLLARGNHIHFWCCKILDHLFFQFPVMEIIFPSNIKHFYSFKIYCC